ncbi:MAG: M20/M25/M40 family metallo-hydrolase [Candidatus Binatia bacterium]|jgi:acetylornithine deacetylase/succinyl-diaminopimelate desuccinylase-like protein
MDASTTRRFIEQIWGDSIVPALEAYVRIPNQSPAYDPEWQNNGYMDAAVELIAKWIRAQGIAGLALNVMQVAGRTPLICVEVPGDASETVLLYGHLDKQPPMDGWHEGLGPWKPVIKDGRLYGRGAADDGYAAFAAITAINALRQQGLPHARCVVLIEASEESGSGDLSHYVDVLADRLGHPSLVVCLDSGCGDYERLWMTSSLRGLLNGALTVRVLTNGVHSGAASGIVPSSFRIARQLLSRLEDECTGAIIPREFYVEVPPERARQIAETAAVMGRGVRSSLPFSGVTRAVSDDVEQLLLNGTWRPQLEITGAAGLPPLDRAGNVLRPVTALKISLRLPPTLEANTAADGVRELLQRDPPYAATVAFECAERASGWNAPSLEPWLERAAHQASVEFFGKPPCYMGEGGTIPFMAMLGERFRQAQFVVTGVLGPQSNAHGPNEFLDLATAERVTACVARVLHEHHQAKCR